MANPRFGAASKLAISVPAFGIPSVGNRIDETGCEGEEGSQPNSHSSPFDTNYQLPITKWPCQSGAPVGAAPPTRSQLRLQRHTQVPVQAETMAATSPP